ncbi:MAG TPA: hypothetical protein VHM19_19505, partial [Polyangiales bacterium]|nr:hypothetical protein [Polyangiales bacterium]
MKQGFALALASLGFACVAGQSIAAWLGMYAIALALLSMPWAQRLLATFDARTGVVLACLLAAPGVAWAVRTREAIAEHEGLHGLGTYVRDRLRLEGEPVIAPPLVAADRPQRFFVRAGVGAKRVQVKLGSAAQGIEAQALGEGLFRVDYDPRRDGVPRPANGTLLASIRVDGREATREMITTTPLAHPRWLSRSPNGERACAVSTETDELFVLASDGLRARVPVADGPIDCAFVDDATVALSYRDHAQLELRGTERGELVRSLELGARQGRMARSPSGAWLAVGIESASPGIVLLDASAQRVLARIATADAPDWIAFGASDDVLLYSTRTHAALHRLRRDAGTGGYAPDGTLALSRPAVTLARIRGGTQLALAVTDYRADGSPQLGNHFVQDQLLFVETGSLRVVWRELTPRRSDRQSKPGDVDRGLSPMGIAENAAGDLLIAFAGSDEAWRLRADDSEPVIEDLASSDAHAPHGIAQLRDGTWLV